MICSLILLEAAEWLLEPKSISKRMNELLPKMEPFIWEKILFRKLYSAKILYQKIFLIKFWNSDQNVYANAKFLRNFWEKWR